MEGEAIIQIGARYTKNGVSMDVHDVHDGEVYVRRWPAGVDTQAMWGGLLRVPIASFLEQVKDAEVIYQNL